MCSNWPDCLAFNVTQVTYTLPLYPYLSALMYVENVFFCIWESIVKPVLLHNIVSIFDQLLGELRILMPDRPAWSNGPASKLLGWKSMVFACLLWLQLLEVWPYLCLDAWLMHQHGCSDWLCSTHWTVHETDFLQSQCPAFQHSLQLLVCQPL